MTSSRRSAASTSIVSLQRGTASYSKGVCGTQANAASSRASGRRQRSRAIKTSGPPHRVTGAAIWVPAGNAASHSPSHQGQTAMLAQVMSPAERIAWRLG